MKRRTDAERQHLIDLFNEKFPVGAKVPWRSVGTDPDPYEMVTVRSAAFDAHGQEVVFFEERSGYCTIDPAHVDYDATPEDIERYPAAKPKDPPDPQPEAVAESPLHNTNSNEFIEVVNLVSGRTFEPLVEIKLGIERAQMSVADARQHAHYILEVAEAAESDAFVFQWLHRDIVGDDEDNKENWDKLITEFQIFREARRAEKSKG